LEEIGAISREVDALYYVDFVASAGGVPVQVEKCNIDLGLLGSQKVLSLMPDLAMVSISPRAWTVINEVGYVGYDALQPWQRAIEEKYMPYTHNWHAMAGLQKSLEMLFAESLAESYRRHADVARYCRERLRSLGIKLWAKREEYAAPTVTAAELPDSWEWQQFDQALRKEGVVVGGNYGPLAGKVFRIGHMGTQANRKLVEAGLDAIERVLAATRRPL
jgi:aspartate aminotransferase-like enzyme